MSITRFLPVITAVALLGLSSAADAQTAASPAPVPAASAAPGAAPSAGPHHRRHRGNAFMRSLRTLDLTDAQKQQIATFRDQERTANQNADAATRQANAAKMRSQIMGILTPDQKAKLAAAHSSARGGNPAAPATSDASPAPQQR